MCESDQARLLPVLAAAQEGEAAIIEAGAHTNSVALGVEANQWNEDQMQPLWGNDLATTHAWLQDAEAVRSPEALSSVSDEPEPAPGMWSQHRKIPAIAAFESDPDWGRIELAVDGLVERDATCRAQQAATEESLTDSLGVQALFALPELASAAADVAAKRWISHGGGGRWPGRLGDRTGRYTDVVGVAIATGA